MISSTIHWRADQKNMKSTRPDRRGKIFTGTWVLYAAEQVQGKKTTIVRSIIDAIESTWSRYFIWVVPTGKAAERENKKAGTTIHFFQKLKRLAEWKPFLKKAETERDVRIFITNVHAWPVVVAIKAINWNYSSAYQELINFLQ